MTLADVGLGKMAALRVTEQEDEDEEVERRERQRQRDRPRTRAGVTTSVGLLGSTAHHL